jgi:hypothetical protein
MASLVEALRASSSALAVFTGALGSGRTPAKALPSPGRLHRRPHAATSRRATIAGHLEPQTTAFSPLVSSP